MQHGKNGYGREHPLVNGASFHTRYPVLLQPLTTIRILEVNGIEEGAQPVAAQA